MTVRLSALAQNGSSAGVGGLAAYNALPRPTYCLAGSDATTASPTTTEAIFLDGEFRRVGWIASNALNGASGTYDTWDNSRVGAVLSYPGYNYAATGAGDTTQMAYATNASSEFGNDGGFFASERGVMSANQTRFASQWTHRASFAFVNSDHADKTKVLQVDSGQLQVSPLWSPRVSGLIAPSRPERKGMTPTSVISGSAISNMIGSGSYNQVRKEFCLVASNPGKTGMYDFYIWTGIDFDGNGVDVTALSAAAPITFQVDVSTVAAVTGWTVETQYHVSPVLCDDGTVYLALMFPSSVLRAYRVTRPSGPTPALVTYISQQTLNSVAYGLEQGQAFGAKSMQTRDGNMVIIWCPYYYYGSGFVSYVIDKRSGTIAPGPYLNTSLSYNLVKYRDDSFALYLSNQAAGSSNSTGAYISHVISRRAGQIPLVNAATIYMPEFPSNVQNYWALTHVWEYNLQSNLVL